MYSGGQLVSVGWGDCVFLVCASFQIIAVIITVVRLAFLFFLLFAWCKYNFSKVHEGKCACGISHVAERSCSSDLHADLLKSYPKVSSL